MEIIDFCHICGIKQKMSYEHIPPHLAYNSIPRKMVSLDIFDVNNEDQFNAKKHRYKQFQKGFGYYSLCEKCNNATGDLYGKEYVRVIKLIGNSILKIPKETRESNGVSAKITIEDMDCRAFFKQIISMFCSVNSVKFGTQFKDYLLSSDNIDFDTEKYKVCIYLHSGSIDRVCDFCVLLNPCTKEYVECSEISLFPMGFILYNLEHSKTDNYYGADITDWAIKSGEKENIVFEIPFYKCTASKCLSFK